MLIGRKCPLICNSQSYFVKLELDLSVTGGTNFLEEEETLNTLEFEISVGYILICNFATGQTLHD